MSKDQDANPDAEEQLRDRGQLVDVPALDPSFALQLSLMFLYNTEDSALPLTLATPAGLITGLAVHPAAWYRAMADRIRAAPRATGNNAEFATVYDTLANDASREFQERKVDRSEIGMIYMDKALIVPARATGPMLFPDMAPWQVNIQHVAAWTIGVATP